MKTYKIPLYTCSCGYETIDKSNAGKHTKTLGEHTITSISTDFVTGHRGDEQEYKEKIDDYETRLRDKDTIIKKLKKFIDNFIDSVSVSDEDEDDEGISVDGIIYYITDRDVPTRGKIGRTKNTDIKKLKTRYSTFGKPNIMCFYAQDIKTTENELKKDLRDNGCMDLSMGKETIFHNDKTIRIFCNFVNKS